MRDKKSGKIELIFKNGDVVAVKGDVEVVEELERVRSREESLLKLLKNAKKQFLAAHSESEKIEALKMLAKNGVPITHVREYIGDSRFIREIYKKLKYS